MELAITSKTINGLDVHTAKELVKLLKYKYKFQGIGGVTNCDTCDAFDHVYEYTREDGLVCFFCSDCLPEDPL